MLEKKYLALDWNLFFPVYAIQFLVFLLDSLSAVVFFSNCLTINWAIRISFYQVYFAQSRVKKEAVQRSVLSKVVECLYIVYLFLNIWIKYVFLYLRIRYNFNYIFKMLLQEIKAWMWLVIRSCILSVVANVHN